MQRNGFPSDNIVIRYLLSRMGCAHGFIAPCFTADDTFRPWNLTDFLTSKFIILLSTVNFCETCLAEPYRMQTAITRPDILLPNIMQNCWINSDEGANFWEEKWCALVWQWKCHMSLSGACVSCVENVVWTLLFYKLRAVANLWVGEKSDAVW